LTEKGQAGPTASASESSVAHTNSDLQSQSASQEEKDHLALAGINNCLGKIKKIGHEGIELFENLHIGLSNDVCDTTAQLVNRVLCGVIPGIPFKGSLNSLAQEFAHHHAPHKKTVYFLHLPALAHSLAVVRAGDKAVVLQSWDGYFSLDEWLEGGPPLATSPLLPKHGAQAVTNISNHLNSISHKAQEMDDDGLFEEMRKVLGDMVEIMDMESETLPFSHAANGAGLEVHWSKAPVSNDE
jgi:hypothetical protein